MAENKTTPNSEKTSGRNQLPKIAFADFSAPFKDPVPPMLKNAKKAGSDAKTRESAENPTFGMNPDDFTPDSISTKHMSDQGKKYSEQYRLRFYFPGETEEQPYKADNFRYCYTFFKRMGNRGVSDIGDVSSYIYVFICFQFRNSIISFSKLIKT